MEDFGVQPESKPLALKWSETSVQFSVAIFLAMIAGYLDGYGLLFLKTYVSFMSGNTTSTGLKIGQHDFWSAVPTAIAIVSFVGGSFLGNLLTQSRLRHSHRILFGLIAIALATVAYLDLVTVPNIFLGICLLSVGMGMTNPALSKIGAESVSLTFMTGTLSRIGGHLASAAGRQPLSDQQGPGDSHLIRAGIDASVWGGFLIGAILSGLAGSAFHAWALIPPCLVMLVLVLFSDPNATTSTLSPKNSSSKEGGLKI